MKIETLKDVVKFNSSFKTAVNLYLSLNKTEKILNYIPTKSSVRLMDDYLQAVMGKKEHATLLVGPYGKGKSHLLLVLLGILSLKKTKENEKIIGILKNKIKTVEEVGNKTASDIEKIWRTKKFLPVIINDTKGDLNQSFLKALSDALKRDGLEDLIPDTYFSEALKRISEWKEKFPDTYEEFESSLKETGQDIKQIRADLKQYSRDALIKFQKIYPQITAGSTFNPLASSEVLPIYKGVSEKLAEEYGYTGIYIVFDEFSKFIEGFDKTNAGHTMKLIQDMCELAADSSNAQIYFTMVAHKSIKEYGKHLSGEIINAFTGIEGRIIEKFFVTSSKNNYELIRSAIEKKEDAIKNIPGSEKIFGDDALNNYYQLPAFRSNFSKQDFESIIFKGCYPLNPIAAYLLLNISEKVAQNERTLFTFISNDEPYSLARYVSEHQADQGWVIGADLIYNYFSGLFKKEVSNELIHNLWLGAEYAISNCETTEEIKLVKTLAVIQIVNKNDEIPANEKYLSLAASLIDGNKTIDDLVKRRIIYKKDAIDAFVFKTKAGSELKAEIKKQREIRGNNCNYSKALQEITGKYFIIPRRYNAEIKMTRYFRHEYMNADTFLSVEDARVLFAEEGVTDGKVLTIYSFKEINQEQIEEHYKKLKCRKLIVIVPTKKLTSAKKLMDFEILQGIKENQKFIEGNAVLKKEIPLLEEDIEKVVEDEIENIYLSESAKVLFWIDEQVFAEKSGKEEDVVNKCCESLYFKTPQINNEIVNRSEISTGATKRARLTIISAILDKKDSSDFYRGTNQEATIYRALFCRTGIVNGHPDKNIAEIISLLNAFVDSCCDKRVQLSEIVETLMQEPYGMRKGVIPFYLARVLTDRHEDLIAYFADMEVPISSEIIVNMCEKPDTYSLFVSKTDFEKENYIEQLNQLFDVTESRALTENRIKNILLCMQRWFRALPQVTRNIAGFSEYENNAQIKKNMRTLRKLMQKVELNPYEILFIDIPHKFATESLDATYAEIVKVKEAFDTYLLWITRKAIDGIYQVFGGQRKSDLYHMLKEWYEKQSELSKQGLHSGSITNLMSCIEKLDVYNDNEVAQKIVKAVTNVYIENWLDNAYEEFVNELVVTKDEIEHLREEKTEGKLLLSFTGSKGTKIERYYEKADEGTGTVLRNIIEDTLEEYDDLSVNDRVSILLEMIEKIIG